MLPAMTKSNSCVPSAAASRPASFSFRFSAFSVAPGAAAPRSANSPAAARTARSALLLVLVLGLAASLTGCGPLGLGPAGSATADSASAAEGSDEVALRLGGKAITVAEVDEHMQKAFLEELLRQPAAQIYEAREKAARDLVQRTVVDAEAKKAGVTNDELFEQVVGAVADPTPEDVATWFTQNESRLRGAKLEQVSSQITDLLRNERRGQAWTAFIGPKIDALDFQMLLEPPREDLEVTRLLRGDANAPVTLMAFSDYQCPYCIRAEPVLAEVLERFPGKVKLVHRHFPLDSIHPFARPAAEAAMCADEQGKFWEFHDAIFASGGQLEASSFAQISDSLGLDKSAMGACIEERRYADFVQKDFEAGRDAGVTGTPAFFVNGILLKGSRTADDISAVVESELERLN